MASLVSSSFRFLIASASCAPGLVRGLVEKTSSAQNTDKEIENVRITRSKSAKPSSYPKGQGLVESLPEDLPSIIDIKKALPTNCFKSSLSLSMYFAIKDLVIAFSLYKLAVLIHSYTEDMPALWYATLGLYWFAQSTMGMALFVAGHDCGHGSFSNSSFVNDTMGNVLHSVLMCPYYMWKLSHKHHHKHTANLDKDEVFYPISPKDAKKTKYMLPGFGLGLGWFIYLFQGYTPRNVGHFNPLDKMFTTKVLNCTISLASLAIWSTVLFKYYLAYGFLALFVYYIVPVFGFGTYLVMITMLHHTEMNMPWYPDAEWDFVKGQLSTVDRDYGFIHSIIHNIGTHQMHHMFIKIPHYRLEEATRAFRKTFPELVKRCDEPIIPSFFRMAKVFAEQRFMPKSDTKYQFKHQ